jgi:hypothetical protein
MGRKPWVKTEVMESHDFIEGFRFLDGRAGPVRGPEITLAADMTGVHVGVRLAGH